jgi:hypothetical protein
VFDFLAKHGGTLVLFDLTENGAAMASSPNCAMEVGLLYQIFGVDIEPTRKFRQRVKLVVLKDDDIGDGTDEGLIAAAIARKLVDPKEQDRLFLEAYKKCERALREAQASQILGRWINDFMKVAEGDVTYLEEAFFRLIDEEQLTAWTKDNHNQKSRANLNVTFNRNLIRKWARAFISTLLLSLLH